MARRFNCESPKDIAVSTKHPCLGAHCEAATCEAKSADGAFDCQTMPSHCAWINRGIERSFSVERADGRGDDANGMAQW